VTQARYFRPKLRPGFDQRSTRLAAEGGWYTGEKVRFNDEFAENMRGWRVKTSTAMDGTARAIHTWFDLAGSRRAAFGTECLLYVFEGGELYEITPVRTSAVITSAINTSADSLRIVVSATHGMTTDGDFVLFTNMSATIGGNIFLSGRYETSVISLTAFAIDVSTCAAATSAAAGVVTANFLVTCGSSIQTAGFGYGAGGYGEGTYGTPRSTTTIVLDMQQWTFDNFGEDLLANVRGGGIFHWNVSAGVSVRASIVATAPSRNNFILVSPEDRHLISFGGTDVVTSVFDPLLVQWADTESYTLWTPTVTNAAGSFRLTDGSKVMAAERSRGQINIWTDFALYAMQFRGPPFFFQNKLLATNCGLIAPHAAVDVNGRSYWMGNNHNFYVYDGTVKEIPCPVSDEVFGNINGDQDSKVFAGINAEFGEVIWLYPSGDSTECSRYVIYNYNDKIWYTGSFDWTVWADQGVYANVLTVGTDSRIYDHELHDVYTADSSAIESYIESGDFDIEDGDSMLFISKVAPDVSISNGTLNLYVTFKKYPNDPNPVVKGPYDIGANTQKISLRGRGRVARLKYVTSGVSVPWRLGYPAFQIQSDGQR
jgi:hypothetical protein